MSRTLTCLFCLRLNKPILLKLQIGTEAYCWALLDEVEKDSLQQPKFFKNAAELVAKGHSVLEAFRATTACQRNAYPPAKTNTYTIFEGSEQAGKSVETHIQQLKGWTQAREAPVLITMNGVKELTRFKDSMGDVGKLMLKIWKLAGLRGKDSPRFKVFEGKQGYEDALQDAWDGDAVEIPLFLIIDHPKKVKLFREEIVPIIASVCGTTLLDGLSVVPMNLGIDEGDLGFRGGSSAGEEQFLTAIGGASSLYELSSSVILITATTGAIHLNHNRMGTKEQIEYVVTPSSNYWGYVTGQEELPLTIKAITRQTGDLGDMVQHMVSSTARQCGMVLQSSVASNAELEKQALRAAVENRKVKGFMSVSWTANEAIIYASDKDVRKAFDSGGKNRWFKKAEVSTAKVIKVERAIMKERELTREREEEAKEPKSKKRKSAKRKKDREEEPEEEEPEEEESEQEECGPIFRYIPANQKDCAPSSPSCTTR